MGRIQLSNGSRAVRSTGQAILSPRSKSEKPQAVNVEPVVQLPTLLGGFGVCIQYTDNHRSRTMSLERIVVRGRNHCVSGVVFVVAACGPLSHHRPATESAVALRLRDELSDLGAFQISGAALVSDSGRTLIRLGFGLATA